jgi:hypothetical protein
VPEIVKPLTERQILKAKAKGKKITTEDGSKLSFLLRPRQAGKTLTDEQEFLKLLVNQISSMQTDNAQGMEKLVAAFRNIKVEVAQAPAPEVKVEVEAAKSPEVLVNIDSPKEWEFTVFRDHNGLIERLLAIRKK